MINLRMKLKISTILIIVMMFSGCTEDQMLQQLREYFPDAILINDNPNMIHIETNVHGVSQEFINICFKQFLLTYKPAYGILDRISGKNEFVLGFDEYQVIWEIGSDHYSIYHK